MGLSELIHTKTARNQELLSVRAQLQAKIDRWHHDSTGTAPDEHAYRRFLEECGYLVPLGAPFDIDTDHIDEEIASIPGPQLVVPVTNARYALNAANARWGSLYDSLYGTDALGSPVPSGPYDPARGARVIDWARGFLDDVVPLAHGSHRDAVHYAVNDAALLVKVAGGATVGLREPKVFAGYLGATAAPSSLLLRHHGLNIEIVIDQTSAVGSADKAGVTDVVIESAVTAIMDFEDSVATVDAEDKTVAYRNWLGLMKGDLTQEVSKAQRTFTRALNQDRTFIGSDGTLIVLPGTSLMLVRSVGHLMTTPAVQDREGNDVPEGLLDAMVTVLAAMHDLTKTDGERNSRLGSVYVVKPKMHGPEEVAFADEVFTHVEQTLGLPANTVKIGIMDEERRTTLNLMECIRAAKSRVAFINTGFLDRTGDEIHTSMHAGPMVRKADMKRQRWITAYED